MRLRDIRQQAAAHRVLARKIAVPEWTIRGDGETVLLAPGQHGITWKTNRSIGRKDPLDSLRERVE